MLDDGDRVLDLIGVGLVLFIVIAVSVLVLAAANAPYGMDTPDVDWTIDRVNESAVRITHAGGDSLQSANIVVTVDGVIRHAGWPEQVTEGDSGIVHAEAGAIVRLYWTGGRGDRSLLLKRQVPGSRGSATPN